MAVKSTPAASSDIVMVPLWRLAIGLPQSWPTNRSILRSCLSMAYLKARGAVASFLTEPRSDMVAAFSTP